VSDGGFSALTYVQSCTRVARVFRPEAARVHRHLPSGLLAFARLAVSVAVMALLAENAHAQVSPGEVIGPEQADRVKGLVSPGVEILVRRGMELRIVPYRPVELRPSVKAATEQYAAQASLDANGVLTGWVAGLPFPRIDPSDPQAGTKVMYNVNRTPNLTDDLGLHLIESASGTLSKPGEEGRFDVERHFTIDWLRMLRYAGRLEIEPKPTIADNPDGVFQKMAQYPFLEPFDLKGTGLLSFRYLDPSKQDDTWLYMPALRRVRRLSSSQRSDALFGQDIDLDSYNVYSGDVSWFTWRLLGEKQMLGSMHGENMPPKPCTRDGGATFCDAWEMRPVFVIEGSSKLPGYAYSKRVLFVDKETFLPLYSDVYDASGELWKTMVQSIRVARKPNPDAALEYPDEMPFIYGFAMVDLQLLHGTRSAIPGTQFREEPGWYFNMGPRYGNDERTFTVTALMAAGR